jgi:protein-L-isoaspartate(D-aspartate) O-methyltransferase
MTPGNQELVNQLKLSGVLRTRQLEAAFRSVPRHLFLAGVASEDAYRDRAVITKTMDGRPTSAVSQPSLVASMLEQVALRPGQRVLEIGTGSGYATALMAHVVGPAGRVVSIDIDPDLVASARVRLANLGYSSVVVVCADGARGYPPAAPFDAIVVTVGAWDIPPAWWDQLGSDGRLVIPLWLGCVQRCIAFRRRPDRLESVSIVDCDMSTTLRGKLGEEGGFLSAADFGTLRIGHEASLALGPAGLRRLFAEPWHDAPIGLSAPVGQLFSGFYLWLALRERGFGVLTIGGGPRSDGIRCLVHLPGKSCSAAGLATTSAVAFMMPPPEFKGCPDPFIESRPLQVWARTFGRDEGPARRLTEQAIAWASAGRPSTVGLRVCAYPSGVPVSALEDEHVIRKDWTTLVLKW